MSNYGIQTKPCELKYAPMDIEKRRKLLPKKKRQQSLSGEGGY